MVGLYPHLPTQALIQWETKDGFFAKLRAGRAAQGLEADAGRLGEPDDFLLAEFYETVNTRLFQ